MNELEALPPQTPPVPPLSEEMQEMMQAIPSWLTRWGNSIIALTVLAGIAFSHFVRYPDMVTGRVTLSTEVPPVPVLSRISGRISLLVREGATVRAGVPLALVENTASLADVQRVDSQLAAFKTGYYRNINKPGDFETNHYNLGDIQPAYARFVDALDQYRRQVIQSTFAQKIRGIKDQIHKLEALNKQLTYEQALTKEEYAIILNRFRIDSELLTNKVISKADWEASRTTLLQAQRKMKEEESRLISNSMLQTQLLSSIEEQQLSQYVANATLQNALESAIKNLDAELLNWKHRYVLDAPLPGIVSFPKARFSQHSVQAGDHIMSVLTDSLAHSGEILIPIVEGPKVAVGQRVRLEFDSYPYSIYGSVTGRITHIASIPGNGVYAARFSLPKGLVTTYRKRLPFRQEMQGTGKIITKDKSVFDRLLEGMHIPTAD